MAVDQRPHEYRQIWAEKPVLKALYQSYYRQILARCRHIRLFQSLDNRE